jgi:WD40 repeat protein
MRILSAALPGLLLAVAGGLFGAAPPAASPNPAEVAGLIKQLGDEDFRARKAAMRRLERLGERALPALRKVVGSRADVDVRLRAGVVAAAIRNRLYGPLATHQADKGWTVRVVLSRDGKRAISCGDTISVWDLEKGKVVRSFGSGGWGLSLSRDGKRLLCSARDRSVYLYEVATGKVLQRFVGHTGEVWMASLCPDGKHAVTGGLDSTLRVWDLETGKEVRRFENVVDFPRCAAWSPDGAVLAVGHYDNLVYARARGTLRLWDFKTGKELRKGTGHTAPITAVAFSRDGKHVASSSFDWTVRLWRAKDCKEVKRFKYHEGLDGVALTPDGRRLLACSCGADAALPVWDVASGKRVLRFEGHAQPPIDVAVTPDGRRAVSVGKDGTLRVWRLPR